MSSWNWEVGRLILDVDAGDFYELKRQRERHPKPHFGGSGEYFWVYDGHFHLEFNSWTKAARFAVRWSSFLCEWIRLDEQADSWGYL